VTIRSIKKSMAPSTKRYITCNTIITTTTIPNIILYVMTRCDYVNRDAISRFPDAPVGGAQILYAVQGNRYIIIYNNNNIIVGA